MDVREIRYLHFRELVEDEYRRGGTGALKRAADRLRLPRTYVANFGGELSDTDRAKGRRWRLKPIGPALARKIEKAFRKPDQWMDEPYPDTTPHEIDSGLFKLAYQFVDQMILRERREVSLDERLERVVKKYMEFAIEAAAAQHGTSAG